MTRLLPLALAIAGACLGVAAAQQTSQADALFEAARAAESHGSLEEALRDYNGAIQLEDQWQFRLWRGLLQLRLNDAQAAAEDFDRVVQTIPTDTPRNLYFKAVALSNRTLARQRLRKQLHPDLEDYENAVAMCREIIASSTAESQYVAAANHHIGITLVLEAELLQEQSNSQDALSKLNGALEYLPQTDHHWRGKAFHVGGTIEAKGVAWQQGLNHLGRALQEAESEGEVTELAKVLSDIAEAERDLQKKRSAVRRLTELSFEALRDADYWNAWRAARLAVLYAFELHDPAATAAEIRKVDGSGWISKYPALDYQLLFARAKLAHLNNDGPALQAAETQSEEVLKGLAPGSSEALEVRILEMELAAYRNDFKRALTLGEAIQEALFKTVSDPSRTLASVLQSNAAAFPSRTLASVLHTMAETYVDMGLLPDGLDLLRRSISLYQELNLVREATAAKLHYAQIWARIDPEGREDPQRKAEWRRALEELAPSVASLDTELKNAFHIVYAIGLFQINEIEAASEHLKSLDREAMDERLNLELSLLQARVALKRNQLDEAYRSLLKAGSQVNSLPAIDRQSYFAVNGELMRKRGLLTEALENYRKAMDISDRLSAQSPDVVFQANLRDSDASLYDGAIETAALLTQSDPKRYEDVLLEFVLKAVIPARPIERTGINKDFDRSLSNLAVHRMIFAAWPEFHHAHPAVPLTEADLRLAFRRDYAHYFSMLPEAHGEVVTNRHLRAITFLQERSRLPKRQVRLYYIGRESGAIFVFEGGRVSRCSIIAKARLKRLGTLADAWRTAITALTEEQDTARASSRELLATLFPEGWQDTPQQIEIVAHEKLWDIAFETLITSPLGAYDTRYLDEDRAVSYLTPVTLSRVTARGTRESARTPNSGFFFLYPRISAPDVEPLKEDPRFVAILKDGSIPRSHIYTGRNARERRLYSETIQRSRWLHFTTHSAPENKWEDHVGLALSADESIASSTLQYSVKLHTLGFGIEMDFRGDGFLSPRDIETMDLRTEFVFLHGCQTAHGRISSSSGLLGLVSAFLAAGSEAVIASHWNVAARDEISIPIASFYGTLLKSNPPLDTALRQLRAGIRAQGAFGRHPYAWASFSIYR